MGAFFLPCSGSHTDFMGYSSFTRPWAALEPLEMAWTRPQAGSSPLSLPIQACALSLDIPCPLFSLPFKLTSNLTCSSKCAWCACSVPGTVPPALPLGTWGGALRHLWDEEVCDWPQATESTVEYFRRLMRAEPLLLSPAMPQGAQHSAVPTCTRLLGGAQAWTIRAHWDLGTVLCTG